MKNLKQMLAAAAAFGIVLAASGCGSNTQVTVPTDSTSSAEPVESTGMTIGIALPSEDSSIWSRDGAEMVARFEERGYDTKLVYSKDDAKTQATDVSALLKEGCDLLIVAPVDPSAIGASLAPAKEAEIPVVSLGSLITDTDAISCAILPDYYKIGVLQAQAVIDALDVSSSQDGKSYKIELAAGSMNDQATGYIYNGIYDTIAPYLSAGTLKVASEQLRLTEAVADDAEAAKTRMTSILDSNYSKKSSVLSAVICGTDETARGVAEAIDRDYSGKNEVLITGYGAEDENMKLLLDGEQTMTSFTAVCNEALAAVDISISLLTEEVTDSYVTTHSGWKFKVTYDTLSYDNGKGIVPAFLLQPTAVTKDNYEKVLVDAGYYQMDGKYPVAVH